MTTINHSRGNELPDHRAVKLIACQMMRDADFHIAVSEHCRGDVVGLRRVGARVHVLILEFERTVRNIVPNILRDLAHKSDQVLVVCLPPLTPATVELLLARNLPTLPEAKVTVVTKDQLTVSLLRSMNGGPGVDSGLFRLIRGVDSEEMCMAPDVVSGCFGIGELVATPQTDRSQEGGAPSARTDGIWADCRAEQK